MTVDKTHPDSRRQGGWLPGDQDGLEEWLRGHRDKAESNDDRTWHPVMVEFRELIDSDPVVRMYLEKMIEQVPSTRTYRDRHVHDLPQLLRLIDEVLSVAPEYGPDAVVTPLGAILDWSMGTDAGHSAFRDPRVNGMLAKVLGAWCGFLSGPDSRYVLNTSPSGWLGPEARAEIGMHEFEHDPDDEHAGFASWNDFFTRTFTPGARPVAGPDDDSVITSACESTPYRISTNVSLQERFWAKGQPYSMADLLANDPSVDEFDEGTVYQAFLSAMNYHRWHSPVSGTVVRTHLVDGTYFSEADGQGDALQPTFSQSYLAHVSARAIVVIDADNPTIGRMAFIAVGMSEVSSCVIHDAVAPGSRIEKGAELGYFQFGGSTHCLIFRRGAIGEFTVPALPQMNDAQAPLVLVNSHLATAATSDRS